jgi:hypothetical protein
MAHLLRKRIMALSKTDIQHLYIAYLNRPADSPGLHYWERVPAELEEVATNAFGVDREFQERYAGAGNKELVKALYHNLFGRAGDTGGVDYWSGLLGNGALTLGNVAVALIRGATGADRETLSNKAQLAQEWTEAIEAIPGGMYAIQPNSPVPGVWLEQVTDAASLQAARAAMPAMIQAATSANPLAVSGQVLATGYLRHATVFIDSNNNGKYDNGEKSTQTDDKGHFALVEGAPGIGSTGFPFPPTALYNVLATGGVDAATGRVHTGTQTVQALQIFRENGKVVKHAAHAAVTPLTTLHDALVAQGLAGEAAQARLAAAFGIEASLAAADPLAAALDADPGAQGAALRAHAIHAQVDGVLAVMARALMHLDDAYYLGAQATVSLPYSPPAFQAAAALKGLASVIAARSGPVTLDHAPTILDVLGAGVAAMPVGSTARKAFASLDTAGKAAFGAIVAEAAGATLAGIGNGADVYTAQVHIGQAGAALSAIADVLPQALAAHQAAAQLPKLTGNALAKLAASTDIGDIDPFSHADNQAIALANGVPPVQGKPAVEQWYVALLGRPASAAELAAGMAKDSAALAAILVASQEFLSAPSGQGNAQLLNSIYVHAFGRQADTDGLLYWTGLLDNKTLDFTTAAASIVAGAAASDAAVLYHKTLAASEFSALLAANDRDPYYDGASGHALGKAWLQPVQDSTTLEVALAGTAPYFRSAIVHPTGVQQTEPAGEFGWL